MSARNTDSSIFLLRVASIISVELMKSADGCSHALFQVKIIKVYIENFLVDVSFDQVGGLCTLCFLEEVRFLPLGVRLPHCNMLAQE